MGEYADEAIDRLLGDDRWGGDHGFFADRPRQEPRCKFCGSTDVRWRQQTGKWVLFDSAPGVVHNCLSKPDPDAFDVVPE